MSVDFKKLVRSFAANTLEVERLLTFDRLIIEVAVDGLGHIERALEERHLHSFVGIVRNRALLLSNVAESESLRPQYAAMFNQCVVLLVSYFGSAVHSLFRQGVAAALAAGADVPAATEELKVSWRGVAQVEGDREAMFADLLIAQHDISFQDMQSIRRAFDKNLNIRMERTAHANNIIVGQAARHVIVHAGGVIDQRMVRQVSGAQPRSLLPSFDVGRPMLFSPPTYESSARV
jgi:hypothetical protein